MHREELISLCEMTFFPALKVKIHRVPAAAASPAGLADIIQSAQRRMKGADLSSAL